MKAGPSSQIAKFTLSVSQPFKWLIGAQAAIGLIWAIEQSLRPYLLKLILNKIPLLTPATVTNELSPLIIIYMSLVGSMVLLFRAYDWIHLRLYPQMKTTIGLKLMNQLLHHSHNFYQNQFSGALTKRIDDVVTSIPNLVKIIIDRFFCHGLSLLIAVYTSWTVSPKFAIGLFTWASLFMLISIKTCTKAQLIANQVSDTHSSLIGNIVDILSNIISVRLFASKKIELDHCHRCYSLFAKAERRQDWFFLKLYAFQGFSFVLFQCICFLWLMDGLREQTLTAGDFGLILALNLNIIDGLWTLSHEIRTFAESYGKTSQALRMIMTPLDIKDSEDAEKLKIHKGNIVLKDISFHYPQSPIIYQDLSLKIPAGQKVGLVGYSGSGKSTFISLLLRLFDIQKGQILIDDQDIRLVEQDSLRKVIAIIPQEPSLFHRTIMENILYGCPDATEEQAIQAAKYAHAHEFITLMPQGYYSLAGERGMKLSGGQRQRIAIARAILKKAPILILDEATSQLDSSTESDIQESMNHLMANKTTLVIAHRLSTLLNMDRIIVFDRGKIVQDGTHHQLIEIEGLYQNLWKTQIGGFLLPDQ